MTQYLIIGTSEGFFYEEVELIQEVDGKCQVRLIKDSADGLKKGTLIWAPKVKKSTRKEWMDTFKKLAEITSDNRTLSEK